MKKYKLINGCGYSYYLAGKVYDESYYDPRSGNSVKDHVEEHPRDWELVESFPDKWCIQIDKENFTDVYAWLSKNRQGTAVFSGVVRDGYGKRTGDSEAIVHYPATHGYYRAHQHNNVKQGYTKITFEQFKQHILKVKTMEVKGYKLKSECKSFRSAAESITSSECFCGDEYDYSIEDNIAKLRRAGVLDKWFDIVYENKLKIGDWVCVTSPGSSSLEKGDVGTIVEFSGRVLRVETKSISWSNWVDAKQVRPATQAEIDSAQIVLPKIGSWSGEYIKSRSMIKYGCKRFSIKTIKELIDLGIYNISIEDEEVTQDDLIQMIKYVKNN